MYIDDYYISDAQIKDTLLTTHEEPKFCKCGKIYNHKNYNVCTCWCRNYTRNKCHPSCDWYENWKIKPDYLKLKIRKLKKLISKS